MKFARHTHLLQYGCAAALLWSYTTVAMAQGTGLKPLTDEEMQATQGQSLFNLSYIAPGGSNPNANTGFYRLGIEAQLALNANINKFQLGCGGVNGAGCDVDIDHLRFTGIAPTGQAGAGVNTDFIANNPFIEFAVNNPNSASTRQVTGLRVGFLNSTGMLSFGEGPSSPDTDPTHHSGINSLSGDLGIIVNNGKIPLTECTVGSANSSRTGCSLGALALPIPLGTATLNANTPNAGDNTFNVNVARSSNFTLNGLKAIWTVLTIPANLTEDFRFIHSLALNNTADFAISLSSLGDNLIGSNGAFSNTNDLKWQRVSNPANWYTAPRGWSMSIPSLEVAPAPGFTTQPVYVSSVEALGGILGFTVPLKNIDLGLKPVGNCYGGLTFC